MSFKPVILIYDLDNILVDEIATSLGATGLYTTINTYNEANAWDAISQYNRLLGLFTNKISCIITGWNSHKTRRDQFLFSLRKSEKRSPFRKPTPVVVITEDHLLDLKKSALDPADGNATAYLHADGFQESLTDILHQIVYQGRPEELNRQARESLEDVSA